MKSFLLACFFAVLAVSSCKVVKYTPEKFPSKQIIWEQGGGFTGVEVSYTLLPNGQLFKRTGVDGPYIELKPLKKKKATPFFEKMASLQLYKQDIEKPGNLYYFLQEVTEATDSRVVWGAGDFIPPAGFVKLYKELNALAERPALEKQRKTTTNDDGTKEQPADPSKW
ncbi:MAG: hypothetical protein CMN32_12105 [Saprospirales bacterium]|nr:hypothetical protein [Saprospirales bacterium]